MPIRLDKLVADTFGLSRRAALEAVRTGRVDLGGARCDEPGLMVEPEAAASLVYDPNRPKARKVVGSGLDVLFEDRHVLILNKPPGLLTLPTALHEADTLLGRAAKYLAIRHGGSPYVGVVHRLDKDTSGAIALAKSPEALRALQEKLRRHDVERRYLAVVEGPPRSEAGTIDRPMAEDKTSLRRGLAREPGEGLRAVTHYRVLERFGPVAALVACWLETGRTHQIRVHLASIGHPVVGDKVYRPPGRPRCKASFRRQALHAQTLRFAHPLTGAPVSAEAPPPADFAALLTDLRNRYGIPGAGG